MAETLGVDYSFSRPNLQQLWNIGYRFLIRYGGRTIPSEAKKLLTTPEVNEAHAIGFSIIGCWEDGASNALGGAAQGKIDGGLALAFFSALGYPTNCPILAVVDFDATAAQIPAIDAYFAAFGAASAPYPVGTYGNEKVGLSLPGDIYMETEAWDGTSLAGSATLYQRVQPTLAGAPSGIDEDVLLRPVRLWGPFQVEQPSTPAPQPAQTYAPKVAPRMHTVPSGTAMVDYMSNGANTYQLWDDGSLWCLRGTPPSPCGPIGQSYWTNGKVRTAALLKPLGANGCTIVDTDGEPYDYPA